ncbi:hypothetical protein TKK_0014111 [Trichogramma kaykai]
MEPEEGRAYEPLASQTETELKGLDVYIPAEERVDRSTEWCGCLVAYYNRTDSHFLAESHYVTPPPLATGS